MDGGENLSRNAAQALLDEWERSLRELVQLLPRLRDEDFETGEALDESQPRGILIHMLRAAYGYAGWISNVLGFPKLERRIDPKSLRGRDEFERAFEDVRDYFVRSLEPLRDEHLESPELHSPPRRYKWRWDDEVTIEQMLEHAVCHNLRHRRQLERRWAPRG